MSNFNEELEIDFHNALKKISDILVDSANHELAEYYRELFTHGMSREDLILKAIQKSNELILERTITINGLFAGYSDNHKKEFIKQAEKFTF